MSTHFVSIDMECPSCGHEEKRSDAAGSRMGKLVVSSSFRCANCSFAFEADGDELSQEARQAFYSVEGKWSLQIRELGPRRVEALHALHAILGNSPTELMAVVRERRPLVEGALVEVECMEEMLADVGVQLVRTGMATDKDKP